MKNKIKILVLAVTSIVISCNNPKVNEGEKELSEIILKENNGEDNTCLMAYADKYDELFTLDDAVKITGFTKADVETEYSKIMKNNTYHDISYKWESTRIKMVKVANMEVKVPMKNLIEVSGIEAKTAEAFKRDFSLKTDAEITEMNKNMNKAVDDAYEGKSESETANKAMAKVKEMGQIKEDVKAITGNMQDNAFSKVLKAYQPVENLADAASWNTFEQRLYVLKNGVKFQVTADLSDDTNFNKGKAIEAAKLILAKCQQSK
jgi:hypothetical protein